MASRGYFFPQIKKNLQKHFSSFAIYNFTTSKQSIFLVSILVDIFIRQDKEF